MTRGEITKADLRSALLVRRAARPAAEQAALAAAYVAGVTALPELEAAAGWPVAAYASMPGEPQTGPLLHALQDAGHTVLLPVVPALGTSLDWAPLAPGGGLVAGRYGLLVPAGAAPLGPAALAAAALVVVPALACDPAGRRLGRGGGYYDRALRYVRPGVPIIALVHDDELLEAVPVEPHDRPVDVVVTPARAVRARRGG